MVLLMELSGTKMSVGATGKELGMTVGSDA